MTATAPVADSLLANSIRALAMDAVEAAKSGHPGMPMGMAEIAVALWHRHLRHNPAHPQWANRDRFVLSNGHGSMLLYALLHLTGYDLPLDELRRFRQLHSKTPGTSGARCHAGRGNDDGAARPGARQRGGDGLERTAAGGGIQPAGPRHRRPPHLRIRRRRLHDGRHLARSLLACRHVGLGQAHGLLRRQRHLDRRRDARLVHRRHAAPVRSVRLERHPACRRQQRRSRRRGNPGGARGHRSSDADLLQDGDRQGRADEGRHGRGAWRSAGREGGGRDARRARLELPAVRNSARHLCHVECARRRRRR